MSSIEKIKLHQKKLSNCRLCENMQPPSIVGHLISSKIILVGQAPGDKEPKLQRPFAWTAGKTLFKWFNSIGIDEKNFRQQVYMSAVCRCFPGKKAKGGDRVPSKEEIQRCSQWLNAEFDLLKPELLIPVGKLAINQFIQCDKLIDVIGQLQQVEINDCLIDVVPLPHPSGASTWHNMQPGKTLLQDALKIVQQHSAWVNIIEQSKI